jgi:hypothetical protein
MFLPGRILELEFVDLRWWDHLDLLLVLLGQLRDDTRNFRGQGALGTSELVALAAALTHEHCHGDLVFAAFRIVGGHERVLGR